MTLISKPKLVIFDLDGTLLDTSDGIIACYNETAIHFGFSPKNNAHCFHGIIGGSLKSGFTALYSMNDATADAAVLYYRELYNQKGKYRYALYPGIAELLISLQKNNIMTAVATLKLEQFAKDMLQHAGLCDYLGEIFGENGNGLTKEELLKKAMDRFGTSPDDTILVGDSIYDADGAWKAKIGFVAVCYGWGFINELDAKSTYHSAIAANASEIITLLNLRSGDSSISY